MLVGTRPIKQYKLRMYELHLSVIDYWCNWCPCFYLFFNHSLTLI